MTSPSPTRVQELQPDLATRFMPLARSLARRFSHTGEPLEDLTQVAYVGLLKAVRDFEPERGYAFSSYAVPKILGELRRHMRDRCWAVHVPRSLKERALSLERERKQLATELRRPPVRDELAQRLGWSLEQVADGEQAAAAYEASSLEDPERTQPGAETATIGEVLGTDDSGYELAEARATLKPLWRTLAERERRVLRLRFGDDLTQGEIGAQLGYSQMHVSRVLRRTLEQLAMAAAVA